MRRILTSRNDDKHSLTIKRSKLSDSAIKLSIEALSNQAYLSVNKSLIHTFGPEKAVFLSNLIDKYVYFSHHKKLRDGKWFFLSHESQIKQTGIQSERGIRKAKQFMLKSNLISVKKIGMPAREYYTIHIANILHSISPHLKTNVTVTSDLTRHVTSELTRHKDNIDKGSNNNRRKFFSGSFLSLFPKTWRQDKPFRKAIKTYIRLREQMGRPISKMLDTSVRTEAIRWTSYPLPIVTAALNASIRYGWRGVFPESAKDIESKSSSNGNKSPSISPQTLLEKHFRSNTPYWIEKCYEPALAILSSSDNHSGSELAKILCRLDNWFTEKQKRPTFKRIPEDQDPGFRTYSIWENIIPDSGSVVEKYISWLQEQSWLGDIAPNVFQPESKVFTKFLGQYQKAVGYDFFTGRSIN